MQMQKVKTTVLALVIVVAVAGAILAVDHFRLCNASPLSRDEALRRATEKLRSYSQKFTVDNLPTEPVEEHYDEAQKTWSFRFRGKACEIIILTDRCHGTDIGGTNGCPPK